MKNEYAPMSYCTLQQINNGYATLNILNDNGEKIDEVYVSCESYSCKTEEQKDGCVCQNASKLGDV